MEGRFPAERERRWKKHTGLPAPPNQWTDGPAMPPGRFGAHRLGLPPSLPSLLTRSSLIRTESQPTSVGRTADNSVIHFCLIGPLGKFYTPSQEPPLFPARSNIEWDRFGEALFQLERDK